MMASISLPVGGVVGVLGDGRDPDAPFAEHGLEGHGVFALAGESRKLPDENLLEGRVGTAGLVQHPAELGAVGDSAALGLVHVLAGDGVAVVLGVVSEGPKLGGHGEVQVLAVAGHPGVEGRRGESCLLIHTGCLLFWVFNGNVSGRDSGPLALLATLAADGRHLEPESQGT